MKITLNGKEHKYLNGSLAEVELEAGDVARFLGPQFKVEVRRMPNGEYRVIEVPVPN